MCACNPESQSHPWLHKKQCGEQVEGYDSPPLLCSDETPPGVLHPVQGPQYKKEMDLLKQIKRMATKMIRGLENLSYEKKLRELWLWGDLIVTFQYLKGAVRKMGRDFLPQPVMTRQGATALK